MDTVKRNFVILITGAGAPGVKGTLSCLENNLVNFKVVGIDTDPKASGRHMFDKFYTVPSSKNQDDFLFALKEIIQKEEIEVLLPQVTRELPVLAKAKDELEKLGCKVLVNSETNIEILNSKHKLINLFKGLGLRVPRSTLVHSLSELKEKAYELGYPYKKVVVKIPISNGLRGLRILDASFDAYRAFIEEKPDSLRCSLESFMAIFANKEIPELLMTEYLPGKELTVDCLANNGESVIILPRTRDKIRTGITFQGVSVEEREIILLCRKIISHLGLSHMFGFQFKYDGRGYPMILECNPRIQGTMVMGKYCNANVILGAILQVLNIPHGLTQERIDYGVQFDRLWSGIACHNNTVIGEV